ncbi:MAG: T9SS type A sorting domain-containing protein [Cytophagales bacterium]|nr:T9SS type A sorting domain-containing protein [Cytophagales bacterium]
MKKLLSLVTFFVSVLNISNIQSQIIEAGGYHSLMLVCGDSTVWACGSNGLGQLGTGVPGTKTTPWKALVSDITAIAAGYYHTIALRNDSTVWKWGSGIITPVQISGLLNITAIATGYNHTLVVKDDGTAWAWGGNNVGQLGDSTTTSSSTPVQVAGGINNFIAVAGGNWHSIALRSDSTVWAWGRNNYGQLGDGTTTNRTTPVQVAGLSNIIAIAAGAEHSLALKNDGTVWTWGWNQYGQLGNGTTSQINSNPIQVFSNSTAIAAGTFFSMALRIDSTVWTWGWGSYGALGDGTAIQRTSPVLSLYPKSIAIAAGNWHSMSVRYDSTVWACGYNNDGQLGNDTTSGGSYNPTPVQTQLNCSFVPPPPPPPPLPSSQTTFQKFFDVIATDDDDLRSVQQTSDGGYIAVGGSGNYAMSGVGNALLIKTDPYGNKLWAKTYGGSIEERGISVQQTTDGGYIVVGWTRSFGAGGRDVYLIKTDTNGDTLWTKVFGSAGNEYGNSVQQTIDGGYIIAGSGLIKTDSIGNLQWAKTYGGWFFSVQQTADGKYIAVGSTTNFGVGINDVYLIKADTNGTIIWTKTYGGSNSEYGASVQQTTDGGYIITGYTESFGAGSGDAFLIKTDTVGNISWAKTYGEAGLWESGASVQQTSDDGYILVGWTPDGGGDVYVIKTDSVGDTLWARTYGDGFGYDVGNSIQQTTDGGYIIGGQSGVSGGYIIKMDANGNSGCVQSSVNPIVGNASFIVNSGATINSGTTVNGTATIVDSPITNDSVSCFNSGCNFVINIDTINITINNGDSIQVGSSIYTATGTYIDTLIASNGCDSIIITTNLTVLTGISTLTEQNTKIKIYPNPFSSSTTLQTDKAFKGAALTVYNSFGQQVKQIKNISGQTVILHSDNLPSGLYFIRLTQDNKIISTDKLVIMD